ncbi:glycosyltransferase [Alloprevotella tannerae]|jgi:hypothetical protein|uniref:glycosyltransferase n=1 Tax=Alloprevotella tannerae TaxID=76122 RepID=UPI003C704404
MQLIVDPRLKYNYASWYLYGLAQVVGRRNISYDVRPFRSLKYETIPDYNSGLALICKEGTFVQKIFIDTEDRAVVFEDRYEWCDVYGKVNPTFEQVTQLKKLKAIGPEFGITLHRSFISVFNCLLHYIKGRKHTALPFKAYLRDYLYTNIRRRPLAHYTRPIQVKDHYIFHASTLWYNRFAATDTNMYRGEFLKACQKAGLQIEGGLYFLHGDDVLAEMPDYPRYKELYKDFIYEQRLSMDDYIRKTQESVLVFNTPSVCECHGWKLAEYLCMGKAIISTPLTRAMPGEGLVHGENVHFVQTPEEIYDAIVRITQDVAYRQKLEQGARSYFKKWISPEQVIRRLLNHSCSSTC